MISPIRDPSCRSRTSLVKVSYKPLQVRMFQEGLMGTPIRRLYALPALQLCRLSLFSRLSVTFMKETQNSAEEHVVHLWDCKAFLEMSMNFQRH